MEQKKSIYSAAGHCRPRGVTMNRDDAVILETFPNRILAQLAAGLLEAEGIDCQVLADDAGGAYPMLQFIRGVRLLVPKEDEARAREILATEAPPEPEE